MFKLTKTLSFCQYLVVKTLISIISSLATFKNCSILKYFERFGNIKKHYYLQDFGHETKVFLPHIFVISYVVFYADLDDSPGSPSTPTHNSNSLSFSSDIRDRDFIDDEICDQPGLIYDNVTANSSGNTIVADDICPSPRPLKPCKSIGFGREKL